MTRASIAALVVALLCGAVPAFAQQPGSGQAAATGTVEVQRGNHQFVNGPPPTISSASCGAGSTVAGSDLAGILVPQQTTCTMTYANVWNSRPVCSLDGEGVVASFTTTTSTLSVTATVAGIPLHFRCIGQPGG